MPQGQPRTGELYRHFKDKLYQIVTVAKHSETGEQLVIYQALYGEFGVYARPLEQFISLVDGEKYPQAAGSYRFQLVSEETGAGAEEQPPQDPAASPAELTRKLSRASLEELMVEFYDARTYEERYQIVNVMSLQKGLTDAMIDNMAVVLDVVIPEGAVDQRLEQLKICLHTYKKYETNQRH